jgi:hypothetical protein
VPVYARLEAAFPADCWAEVTDSVAANGAMNPSLVRETARRNIRDILDHLMLNRDFYRRVIDGAGSFWLFDNLVLFIEGRLIIHSPIGPLLPATRPVSTRR